MKSLIESYRFTSSRILLAAMLAMSASPALAGAFETGETLNDACQSSDPELNAFCFGYLIGVADSLAGKAIGATDPEFCMTEAINQGKVEGVGKWWLANNQQRGHIAADSLVVEALSVFFPCNP